MGWYQTAQRKRAYNRMVREADAILVSFPKTGRTWLRLLLGTIFCLEHQLPVSDAALELGPALKACHPAIPNILVNHSYEAARHKNRLFSRQKRRVILLVREPKDTLVSYYFQLSRRKQYAADWFDGDISSFLRSEKGIERYTRYYSAWLEVMDPAVMVVCYEDLHAKPAAVLTAILQFLGVEISQPEIIDQAIEACEFNKMRQYEMNQTFQSGRMRANDATDETSYKTRSGKVGGYEKHLSSDDVALVDRVTRSLFESYLALAQARLSS